MPTTNPSTLHPNPSPAALPYNPTLSIWLSVDPLSDKYPGVSPYAYCGNNPVVMRDPDGDSLINFYDRIVQCEQRDYDKAVSLNILDLSHEKNNLDDATTRQYYANQFISGLTKEQYATLNNIKDESGNPIDIIVQVDYDLDVVAANKPLWSSDKQLLNGKLFISINPFRDLEGNECNTPMFDWRKVSRHEGGHAYYIIRKCRTYFKWLVKNRYLDRDGKYINKYNGHSSDDKSAEHSRIWEDGRIELING